MTNNLASSLFYFRQLIEGKGYAYLFVAAFILSIILPFDLGQLLFLLVVFWFYLLFSIAINRKRSRMNFVLGILTIVLAIAYLIPTFSECNDLFIVIIDLFLVYILFVAGEDVYKHGVLTRNSNNRWLNLIISLSSISPFFIHTIKNKILDAIDQETSPRID